MFGITLFFFYNYRGQSFLVVLDLVCNHCSRNFGPLLHAYPLQVLGLSLKCHKVSARSKDFLWGSGLETSWATWGPWNTFDGATSKLPWLFWIIVMVEDPATANLQCPDWGKGVVIQNLSIHSSIHPLLDMMQFSRPLQKQPKSMMFPSPIYYTHQLLYCVCGVVLLCLLPPSRTN